MKIKDLKSRVSEGSKLPPHLAKFFDKDGNPNPDAQKRIDQGRAERRKFKSKDVTPKGYGPVDETDTPTHKRKVITKRMGTLSDENATPVDESIHDFIEVARNQFNHVSKGKGAHLNGSTGGLYIDNSLVGYRDNGKFFLDPDYTEMEMAETRLKPSASARAYQDQMDQSHAQQRHNPTVTTNNGITTAAGMQRPPAKLMKAIRDEEAGRRKRKKTEESAWSGMDPTIFLMVPRTNGSVDLGQWTLFEYGPKNGGNPIHMRRMMEEHVRSLGWKHYDVFTQWNGDIDTAIEQAKKQADRYESRKDEFPAQYWDNKKAAEKLKDAKELMADGEEASGAIDEATDPRDVINKFLKSKEQRSNRGQQLRRDRDAKLAQDEQPVEEAVEKIACLGCDGVSTRAAWKKNHGSCPKCNNSSRGVAEASYRDSGYRNMHKMDQKANRQADKDREKKLAAQKKSKPVKEAMPNMGKKVIIAQKGNKVGEFTVPANAQVHHINQELRQIKGLSLGDFERTQVARELAAGKIAKAGSYAFKVMDNRPQEMR